mmetsp:Transcript_22749/g.17178  ORF Transcript_22749/g.17178 Transcript_22749/m.17178 type:complete len:123 (+) Transcript_22749:140-508(+)
MQLDATSDFDGIAVPSSAVSSNNYYQPNISTTAVALSIEDEQYFIDYNYFNDDVYVELAYFSDMVVASENATGAAGDLGDFYFYLINYAENVDPLDPPLANNMSGIMGITPQSVLDGMGVFN